MPAQDPIPWEFVFNLFNLATPDERAACDRSFETPEAATVWLQTEAARLATSWLASMQVGALPPGDIVPLSGGTFACPSGTAGRIGKFAYSIGIQAS